MSALRPRFVRIEDAPALLGVSVEAIRQGCMFDYLPVYLDADGLTALPSPMIGTVDSPVQTTVHQRGGEWVHVDQSGQELQRSPEFTLPQFWRVWNERETESVDGGLAEGCRYVEKQVPICFLATHPRDRAWFPSPRASLRKSKRVRFLDLFVRPEDVVPKDRKRAAAGKASAASRQQRVSAAKAWIAAVLPDITPRQREQGDSELARVIQRKARQQSPQTDATEWLAACSDRTVRNYIEAIKLESRK